MKQIQLTLPEEKTTEILEFLIEDMGIKNIIKVHADGAFILTFRVSDGTVFELLNKLKEKGVGIEYGIVDVLGLQASLPVQQEEDKKKGLKVESLLSVEELYERIKGGIQLDFDFIAFVITSALIAGFGLYNNNVAIIVASMLLSPLMGPILATAFAAVIGDFRLSIKGVMNELIALGLSFFMGILIGLFLVKIPYASLPHEITARGSWTLIDVGVAATSGAAVALAVTRGDMSSLVGVAISASLMPPAVNVGIMLIWGYWDIAYGSFSLLMMNIVLIDVIAIIVFKIKNVTGITYKSTTWKAVSEMFKTESLYHTKPKKKASKNPEE